MALTSESVEITISTIEISLKLQSDTDSISPETEVRSNTSQSAQTGPGQTSQVPSDAPPGYIESLLLKIKNNLKLTINNLILKYVENDIVLSLNIKQITLQEGFQKTVYFLDDSFFKPV